MRHWHKKDSLISVSIVPVVPFTNWVGPIAADDIEFGILVRSDPNKNGVKLSPWRFK